MKKMKTKHIVYFILILGIVFTVKTYFFATPPKLKCKGDLERIIKEKYQADSVRIISQIIQEEIYFDKIICIKVDVYNPKTSTLNFKSLPQRLNDYDKIRNGLEHEGKFAADLVHQHCDYSKFNDIMVAFFEYDEKEEKEKIGHYFSYHYYTK